jgi:hypothetical protein
MAGTDNLVPHMFQKGVVAPGQAKSQRPDVQGLDKFIALAQSDPEAARKLLEGLTKKGFTPHPAQREVMDSTARFLAVDAGRRFGKTKIAAAMCLRRCRRDRQMVWWVAPTYKVVKRGYAEVLRQLPPELLSRPASPETAFDAGRSVVLRFRNGSRMEFYSAERPEGMLGEGVDFAVLDEAATMPEHVWTQIVRPTLADRAGGALFISTPRGRNWFYRMYVRGQDDQQPTYASWRFPSMANPHIPAEEWEEMAETLPRAVYEQEILADFISNAASVFRIPDNAVGAIQQPEGHVVLGVDLAKHQDFTVFCGVRSGDRQPCYHDRFNAVSWPEQRRRLHTAIEKIEQTAESITVMIDSTGVGDVVYDDLSMEGLDCVPVKFTNQWKQQSVMLLAADLERGNAFLNEHQVREFESYAYSITEAGRWKFEAASGHDDEVSAMLLAHWGVVNEGVPDVHMLSFGNSPSDYDDSDEYEDIVDAEVVESTYSIEPPSIRQLLSRGF